MTINNKPIALVELDRYHREVLTSYYTQASSLLRESQNAEARAAEARITAYSNFLSNGFIIDQVIDPIKFTVTDGYDHKMVPNYKGLFAKMQRVPKWKPIGSNRLSAYSGLFASTVSVELEHPESKLPSRLGHGMPQTDTSDIAITFNVMANDPYYRTLHRAPLRAIEWHVPTEAEFQAVSTSRTS